MDFAQARYHSFIQGRFASVDPLLPSGTVHNPQSWNRYAYALNNPNKYVDPTGMVIEHGELRATMFDLGEESTCRGKECYLRGWKRIKGKDKKGKPTVRYKWVNNPKVKDVPDYWRYIDARGRVIVLNGVSSNNWHEWGVLDKGKGVVGHNKGASPWGHVSYGMVKNDLEKAGYFKFWDPHPDHAGGINFMMNGSPTLNITVFAGDCPSGCTLSEPDPGHEVEKVDAHVNKYNPHEKFLDHQLKETLPNLWKRINPWQKE